MLRALYLVLVSGRQALLQVQQLQYELAVRIFYSGHLAQEKDEKSLNIRTGSLSQNMVLSSSLMDRFMQVTEPGKAQVHSKCHTFHQASRSFAVDLDIIFPIQYIQSHAVAHFRRLRKCERNKFTPIPLLNEHLHWAPPVRRRHGLCTSLPTDGRFLPSFA